eukprot:GILK01008791.1.p1 GENE.GILK01008791.1~~GILK01008791.1.p1  ORF type:complete len:223 (-),score=7.04 GILK01008791.1:194-862(-)
MSARRSVSRAAPLEPGYGRSSFRVQEYRQQQPLSMHSMIQSSFDSMAARMDVVHQSVMRMHDRRMRDFGQLMMSGNMHSASVQDDFHNMFSLMQNLFLEPDLGMPFGMGRTRRPLGLTSHGPAHAVADRTHHHYQQDSYEGLLALDDTVKKRGVSKRKLTSLASRVARRADVSKECLVCQDKYVTGAAILQLPCKHEYHKQCISQWFESNRTCPVCRHEVEK